MVNKSIVFIFIITTSIFSFLAYKPADVVIAGPLMTDQELFNEELKILSEATGLKIKYIELIDVEDYLINDNSASEVDLALIPNPQGVVNLGERNIIIPISKLVNDVELKSNFPNHLLEITTSEKTKENYGVFFRLLPNSFIWYDIEKFQAAGSPVFQSYEEMISFTRERANSGKETWCLDSESGASTGWIATNWLEDLILHEYGPEIYDSWSQQSLLPGSKEVILSINEIGKLIFIENGVYGGNKRIVRKEFRNNFINLLSDETDCIFSWSGQYAEYYMPEGSEFGNEYDFFKFPSSSNPDAMVGIGDILVALNNNSNSLVIFEKLISDQFGISWMLDENSSYVPANMNNNNLVTNKLLIKQIELTKQALQKDLFRYDASEVMERRIGADKLLASLKEYIDLGSEEAYKNLELIIEDLQSSF
jgi:alpha-glucoside transport system substrate-binding protein